MPKKMPLQTIASQLKQFWSQQGCMIMDAYDTEKGAGTMSPFTFFCEQLVQSLGTSATLSLPGDQLMVVMVRIPTGFTNTINFKF